MLSHQFVLKLDLNEIPKQDRKRKISTIEWYRRVSRSKEFVNAQVDNTCNAFRFLIKSFKS